MILAQLAIGVTARHPPVVPSSDLSHSYTYLSCFVEEGVLCVSSPLFFPPAFSPLAVRKGKGGKKQVFRKRHANGANAGKVQRTFNPSLHRARQGNTNKNNFVRDRSWTRSPPNGASKFSTYPCIYCGKPDHKAEFCWTRLQLNTGKAAMIVTEETNTSPGGVMADLSKDDSMPIGLISTKCEARESAVSGLASRDFDPFQESFVKDPDVGTFRPFLSQGTVEVDGVETPVTILRDLGCLQTLIKEGVVAARKTDKYVVLGSLWGQGVAPLVLVHVKSSCFSGIANVACEHELLVAGVDLILGNDLAGGQMGNLTPPPVLQSCNNLKMICPVFPLCVLRLVLCQ
ncbi:hypothetical protein Hamer_G031847 [Homarus americanus]|uniref:Uncharacterized protein n=1 Tax=Homarus americanus TaxID=6706 RepID=A0A8J5JH87_HOMAM|nr:hypothetical protein Hamer_G031847 [Homarus americanus]